MDQYTEVLFDEIAGKEGDLGLITLNRPQVLNSLNLNMINALSQQLKLWATTENIKAVVIRAAEGRAFCAGGDIRLTYERMKHHDPAMAEFFNIEYQLNRLIFHYPKPYIAFLDGITMGGGVGISIHGSHRVATNRLLFAMPETGIGFFPDVGGTYFLPRLPGNIGIYLGLTGARISGDDCVALGIAQEKVASEALPQLLDALAQTSLSNNPKAAVTALIAKFKVATEPSKLLEEKENLDACFAGTSVEDILQSCQKSPLEVCQQAAESMLKKSPTSLKVTLRALHNGMHMDFDNCMRQEYRLVNRFLVEHDFLEGIRAVIIDKDQKPIWKPAELSAISPELVETYFAPLKTELA